MFKVLYAPFEGVVGVRSDTHAALVYEGKRSVRVLMQSFAWSSSKQKQNVATMEGFAEKLNEAASFAKMKSELRAVQGVWMKDEMKRRYPRLKPFYPSFSGHGAHGADAWD